MIHNASRYTVKRIPLPELARTFLVLGVLGFGGPAAHLALMERELVTHRAWLSREYFLDLLAAINLVPGPTSTEMAIYIGWITGGFWGAVAAGFGFIAPAVLFSVALAMIYTSAGSFPAIIGLLDGVKPIVLALILSAAYRLGQKAIDSTVMWVLLVLALLLIAAGSPVIMGFIGLGTIRISELTILLGAGMAYVLYRRRRDQPLLLLGPLAGLASHAMLSVKIPTLTDLFGQFFIIGATLFGSGYVLVAYMQRAFVDGLGWMTPQQLLDTLAIGQSTPGPVSSTASAAGYVMTVTPGNIWSGVPGALAATAGVFLPAFVVVWLLGKIVPYLRRYPITLDFLKGVNAGVIALLIEAFMTLAWAALVRPDVGVNGWSLIVAGVAFVALERYDASPLILVGVGAVIGVGRAGLGIP
ncbi:MAG: chromate efflux transporter [Anaerolineae bacterium]|nr:chromate efflux transporter [Anaerolineae bacterium]